MTHRKERYLHTNRLVSETSPYLLQHAHNPVDWYPWGEEAHQKAREENKLIIVSIGYSACHWCHVMERESFENKVIADLMNQHFVSIKVDREERPDIDQIYMTAVQLITGTGGWPLNCFALPDGSPVFGGTYFTPEKWKELLNSLSSLYRKEPSKITEYAGNLKEGLKQVSLVDRKAVSGPVTSEQLHDFFSSWKKKFDLNEGGHTGAPKFPLPNGLLSLLQYYHYTKDEEIYKHLVLTLNKMAGGGIYDHLGGGFARYATDPKWKIPHFEKMLYDNGQLTSVYSQVYQLTGNENYKRVVYETLEFIEREMTAEEGGFYSSMDADSEGVEGKYYVWNNGEIARLLGEDAGWVSDYYQVLPEGNWEDTNILHRTEEPGEFASKRNIPPDKFQEDLVRIKRILLKERDARIRPGLDDKILTSWNALMLKGYLDAYRAFNEKRFLESALRNASFIENSQLAEGFLLQRNYKSGASTINGFLDDYSFLIEALISLYEATFDEHWLSLADNLMESVIHHFYDQKSGMFYYTSDLDPPLVTRKMELDDNVIPASNSSLAMALYSIGRLLDKKDYITMAEQMLSNVFPFIHQQPAYYSNWLRLVINFVFNPHEVVITGPDALLVRQQLDKHLLPGNIIAGSRTGSSLPILKNRFTKGQTVIYICRGNVCKQPTTSVTEAIELLKD